VLCAAARLFLQQAQAEMQTLQAQLTGARKTAQAATGERDKLEVKYRTYKAAARQQLVANKSLQRQLQRAEDEAREAREAAANAWAAVSRGQHDGTGSWADAVSDSEEEAGAGMREAAGVKQRSADGAAAGASSSASHDKA
jgi:chromosome segregation ATPase